MLHVWFCAAQQQLLRAHPPRDTPLPHPTSWKPAGKQGKSPASQAPQIHLRMGAEGKRLSQKLRSCCPHLGKPSPRLHGQKGCLIPAYAGGDAGCLRTGFQVRARLLYTPTQNSLCFPTLTRTRAHSARPDTAGHLQGHTPMRKRLDGARTPCVPHTAMVGVPSAEHKYQGQQLSRLAGTHHQSPAETPEGRASNAQTPL